MYNIASKLLGLTIRASFDKPRSASHASLRLFFSFRNTALVCLSSAIVVDFPGAPPRCWDGAQSGLFSSYKAQGFPGKSKQSVAIILVGITLVFMPTI